MPTLSYVFKYCMIVNNAAFALFILNNCAAPVPRVVYKDREARAKRESTSVKPYPICFFDPSPPSDGDRAAAAEKLVKVMKRFDPEAFVTADDRWVIAKTSPSQHAELTAFWPRVACVGTVTSGTEVKRNADCVSYLHKFLRDKIYLQFDIKGESVHSDEAPGPAYVICCKGVVGKP